MARPLCRSFAKMWTLHLQQNLPVSFCLSRQTWSSERIIENECLIAFSDHLRRGQTCDNDVCHEVDRKTYISKTEQSTWHALSYKSDFNYLSNRPHVSMVYRLINHTGCWKNTYKLQKRMVHCFLPPSKSRIY